MVRKGGQKRTAAIAHATTYLPLEEVQPTVLIAGGGTFSRRVDWTYHTEGTHLILVESGQIAAMIGGRQVIAGAGQLICFPPTRGNRYRAQAGTRTLQMQVEFAAPPRHQQQPWFDEFGPLPPALALGNHVRQARKAFEAICILLPSRCSRDRLRVRAAVFELLALISSSAAPASSSIDPLDPLQIARVKLESNFASQVLVADLARQLGMGNDEFIRRFRERFDLSPRQARTLARMREAARLLVSSDGDTILIKQVAAAVGYCDAKFFTRTFHTVMGVTPTTMRQARPAAPMGLPRPSPNSTFPLNTHILPPDRTYEWANSLVVECTWDK